ncbi:kinase-like domain-containing protein [Lyophyllum atratum]|nr:kinase-like domain-containing protein [Lyophyllum atratum]
MGKTATILSLLVDIFASQVLDLRGLDTDFRRHLIVATQRLAAASGLYPLHYELKNIVYDIQSPLSFGGFADIYKGTLQGQTVCVKAIRVSQQTGVEAFIKTFSKEGILWGQLSNPNVLPIYGFHCTKTQMCLISPWMNQGDITIYLKNTPDAAIDVAQGLLYLHENGIIHGDIKGANILIDDTNRARLADFGISSVSDANILAWATRSAAASQGGTIRWQAPELFGVDNDEVVMNSVASDVYAWSCVCYEIFTGNIPYVDILKEFTVMHKVMSGVRPARPSDSTGAWLEWGLTESIWSLMEDCWKQNPKERPSIEQVISRLTSNLTGKRHPSTSDNILSPAAFREKTSKRVEVITMSTLEGLFGLKVEGESATCGKLVGAPASVLDSETATTQRRTAGVSNGTTIKGVSSTASKKDNRRDAASAKNVVMPDGSATDIVIPSVFIY